MNKFSISTLLEPPPPPPTKFEVIPKDWLLENVQGVAKSFLVLNLNNSRNTIKHEDENYMILES